MHLLALFLLLSAAPVARADESSTALPTLMRRSHQLGVFNGVALVWRKGQVVQEMALGAVDGAGTRALTPDDRFNLGSIGKEFSAVAIMRLRDQGKLAVDDKIARFLPDLPAWGATVSIRNLLEYTSGLPDINWRTVKNDAGVRADLLRVAAPAFEPGTKFAYTYSNVILRQFIVEGVTGLPFREYVGRELYAPCGMSASVVDPGPGVARVAHAFNDDLEDDPVELPVSGIPFVTARDLLKWNQCLHGGKLIAAESLRLLGHSFQPHNGGLGETRWDGQRLVWHKHDGQSRNFEAWMQSDLDRDVTIILLGNHKAQKLEDIAAAIAAILDGRPYRQPKRSVARYFQKQLDALPIGDFIALYGDTELTRAAELDFDRESGLNEMAYSLMARGRLTDAIQLFELNARRFPTSGNVHDSLGEAYLAGGDKARALASYRRALALDPSNENAADVVRRLERER